MRRAGLRPIPRVALASGPVPRAILIPLLGLAGIVLYGSATASRNTAEAIHSDAVGRAPAVERQVIELDPSAPLIRAPALPSAEPVSDTLAAPADSAAGAR